MAKAFIIEDKLLGGWEVKVGNGDHQHHFCNTKDRALSVAAIMGDCKWWEVRVIEDRVRVTTDTDPDGDAWNWQGICR